MASKQAEEASLRLMRRLGGGSSCITASCSSLLLRPSSSRGYATTGAETSRQPRRQIAVLGGGITGLTTAHYLSRHAPNAHITLYEKAPQAGGWVQAKKDPVAQVLLQSGPRMLRSGASSHRYDDLVLYDVLINLGIKDQLKEARAQANTRYLYYPDHLVKLPSPTSNPFEILSMLGSFMTEPLWEGAPEWALNAWKSRIQAKQRPLFLRDPDLEERFEADESVGHFLERFLGDERPVKNIVSAMMHGIHGGDAYKLSAKHTIFDQLWFKDAGRLPPGWAWHATKDIYLAVDLMDGPNRLELIDMAERAIYLNMLAFDDGLLTLNEKLVEDLHRRANVTIKYNSPVTSLSYQGGRVHVQSDAGRRKEKNAYDNVISTLVARQLSEITNPRGSLSALDETHAVTIQVVNLWYPKSDLLAKNPGFGYLVPAGTPNNDAGVLGVLFDSEIQTREGEPGTKLTVMLGGHHWDDCAYVPTPEMGVQLAISTVEEALGIPAMEGMRVNSRVCKECLPQHYVGHRKVMAKAHHQLLDAFGGRLSVAGPSYTHPGVMPAMRAGFEAAMRVAKGKMQPWLMREENFTDSFWTTEIGGLLRESNELTDHVGQTGLEEFTRSHLSAMAPIERQHLWFRKSTGPPLRFTDGQGRWIRRPNP